MTDRAKYWQRIVTAWEASGLTQAEFCRRRDVKAVTFAWWKRQLNMGAPGRGGRGRPGSRKVSAGATKGGGQGRRVGRKVSAGSSKPSFVEVALPDGAGRPAKAPGPDGIPGLGYEVALPCGTSIRLPAGFDVDRASQLILALVTDGQAVARSC